jgi:hypothetical protein
MTGDRGLSGAGIGAGSAGGGHAHIAHTQRLHAGGHCPGLLELDASIAVIYHRVIGGGVAVVLGTSCTKRLPFATLTVVVCCAIAERSIASKLLQLMVTVPLKRVPLALYSTS